MSTDLPPRAPPAVGLDVVDVVRFRETLQRSGDGLERRVFTPAEWAYAATRADRVDVLAARFAAKEAVMKALGTGWGAGVSFLDIEVLGGGRSKPELHLHGKAAELVAARGLLVSISLSHAGTTAAAVALATPR